MDLIAHLASNSPEGRQWLPTGNANRSWNPVQFHAPNAGTATCGWATRSTSGNDGSHAEQQFRDDNDGASSRHRWRAQIYGLPWWPIACEELCLQWIYERSAWYVPSLLTSNTKCCKKRNAKINFTFQLQQQHTQDAMHSAAALARDWCECGNCGSNEAGQQQSLSASLRQQQRQ